MNRRTFIKKGALATVPVFLSATSWGRVKGANESVRLAIVGCGWWGGEHLEHFGKLPDVRIVALCDPDKERVAEAKSKAVEWHGNKAKGIRSYYDYRKLLEDSEVDAVVIATPNHWHTLMAIWACQAGKDVYVEKPLSHNLFEGRRLQDAVAKYGRCVQHGTQRRGNGAIAAGVRHVQSGALGEVKLIRGICYRDRPSIGSVSKPTAIPDHIDYDHWCGPAPMVPVMREKFHYDWHWFWDYGNGDIGNQGVHQLDVCNWFAGDRGSPARVLSVGGRFGYRDDGQTPNTQLVYLDYEDMPILFEVRGLPLYRGASVLPNYKNQQVGVVVQCEGGYVTESAVYDGKGRRMDALERLPLPDIRENFIEAVKEQNPGLLVAPVSIGSKSCSLFQHANNAHLLGSKMSPEVVLELSKGHAAYHEAFGRMSEHLSGNGVQLHQEWLTVGPWLSYDDANGSYVGAFADQANSLVGRDYRAPYLLPENF